MDAGFNLSATKSRDPRFDGSGVLVVELEKPDAQTPDDATRAEPPDADEDPSS
jgi:hypothetical protein